MDNAWFRLYKRFASGFMINFKIAPIEHSIIGIELYDGEDLSLTINFFFLTLVIASSCHGKESSRCTGIGLTKDAFSINIHYNDMDGIFATTGNRFSRWLTDVKTNGFKFRIWFSDAFSYKNSKLDEMSTTLTADIAGNPAVFDLTYSKSIKMLFGKIPLETTYCCSIEYSEENEYVFLECGKGENSWDCEDEIIGCLNLHLGKHIHNVPAELVSDKFTAHIMNRRERRGDAGYVSRAEFLAKRNRNYDRGDNTACEVAHN